MPEFHYCDPCIDDVFIFISAARHMLCIAKYYWQRTKFSSVVRYTNVQRPAYISDEVDKYYLQCGYMLYIAVIIASLCLWWALRYCCLEWLQYAHLIIYLLNVQDLFIIFSVVVSWAAQFGSNEGHRVSYWNLHRDVCRFTRVHCLFAA